MRDPGRAAFAAPDTGHGLTSGAAAARLCSQEKLVGRDCQPRVGMTVKLTEQALERRAENGRADPSKGGTGVIVKCHPNWTCDVMWCVRAAPAWRFQMHHSVCSLRASLFGELTAREPTGTTQNEFAWATRVGQQR
jgi:hypothetical protein